MPTMLEIRPSDTLNVPSLATRGKGAMLSEVISRDQSVLSAAEAYADALLLATVMGRPQPGIDCSTNPNYPAGERGDWFFVHVEGKIGGASGISVSPLDLVYCITTNAGGTQAAVGASWDVTHSGLTGAPLLGAANIFTDVQTILKNVAGALMILDSNDSGAFSGPNYRGTRRKSTGTIGGLTENALDTAADEQTYAALRARILSGTAGAHGGAWDFQTADAGAVGTRLTIEKGIYSPLATGGDKGADTANFKRFYEDGVSAEVAGLLRGYDVWYESQPSISPGDLSPGTKSVWNFRARQDTVIPPVAPDTKTNVTMVITRAAMGIGDDGPGNTDRTLIVQATRGEGDVFKDDTTLGQVNAITIHHHVPQVSSHAAILIDSRRIISDLTGASGSDGGGNSLLEANLSHYSPGLDNFVLLHQQGMFLGHRHNPGGTNYMAGKTSGVWAQSDTSSVDNTTYAVVIADDNYPTTAGYEYSLAQHKQIDEAPYFGITAYGDPDGAPGRVLAKRGISNAFPSYSWMLNPSTGVNNPSSGVMDFIANGVVGLTIQAGCPTVPTYTVAGANNLIGVVAGSIVRISDHAGGSTLAQFNGSAWKTIALGSTITA